MKNIAETQLAVVEEVWVFIGKMSGTKVSITGFWEQDKIMVIKYTVQAGN